MISHPDVPHSADSPNAFIFANLFETTCSICAPMAWSRDQVRQFAADSLGGDGWETVSPGELFGEATRFKPTPHPCNQAPQQRQHWFLIHWP